MKTEQLNLDILAREALLEKGFDPDFPDDALEELSKIHHPIPFESNSHATDLRQLLWCSIDNPDSRDLDQLTYAEVQKNGSYKLYVSIADVDALVKQNSALDKHAAVNTTSIYTPSKIFPMLPEKLSTNMTSLNLAEVRLSHVVEIVVSDQGDFEGHSIYSAWVHNKAKLNYPSISKMLEDRNIVPDEVKAVAGLEQQLRLQDKIAQLLKKARESLGALSFGAIESQAVVQNGEIMDVRPTIKGRADELIENSMIAANNAAAQFLKEKQFPVLRRVVRTPLRWERIVSIAAELGETLPWHPDGKALEQFLLKQQNENPTHFPDLSLTIIKLLGRGEYVVDFHGDKPLGHFGLALREYTHSTAPNRRYPDLITQRLIKAALQNRKVPYSKEALITLAAHCTDKEDDAEKVERKMVKSAGASLLRNRIGETFEGIITGSSEKGVWVRLKSPCIEGKIMRNTNGLDVGDKVKVKLFYVDVARGFIDFERV